MQARTRFRRQLPGGSRKSAAADRDRRRTFSWQAVKTGPNLFEYDTKAEYFFKAFNSGDGELRFTCQISKAIADAEWKTGAFDSICVGGCT